VQRLRKSVIWFAVLNFVIGAGTWIARTSLQIDNMAHLGGFLSGLLQIAYLLAVLAIAVVFLFCPALFLAMFLMSLLPEPLTERQARLWMAERLRERGYGTSAG